MPFAVCRHGVLTEYNVSLARRSSLRDRAPTSITLFLPSHRRRKVICGRTVSAESNVPPSRLCLVIVIQPWDGRVLETSALASQSSILLPTWTGMGSTLSKAKPTSSIGTRAEHGYGGARSAGFFLSTTVST